MFVKIATVLEVCPVSNTASIFFKKEPKEFPGIQSSELCLHVRILLVLKEKKKEKKKNLRAVPNKIWALKSDQLSSALQEWGFPLTQLLN